ncbi:hypothetical protein [Limobrevibacterium gyesilva]|uniref:Uncharacterized protein n=1 Tax=Limobrevibacterium gyesilva TaxID=2991712 RepID=A0AA41YNU5_9PROT|nr:hypothetical protein [Limobrevibacterium gyesilva]MCW3477344.1 hypothetical protein [Limobrevibacterium gyesilva]
MATVREMTPGSQDLATFQTVVQQQEAIFGPLQGIGGEGMNNIMTFVIGPSPDAARATILVTYTGHPPAKDGFQLVAIGTCLVSGAPVQVAAYRPTP